MCGDSHQPPAPDSHFSIQVGMLVLGDGRGEKEAWCLVPKPELEEPWSYTITSCLYELFHRSWQ